MAEYCRDCAASFFGEKVAAKYFSGLCKPGETYMELCEGCGGWVELNHLGWRTDSERCKEGESGGGRWASFGKLLQRWWAG